MKRIILFLFILSFCGFVNAEVEYYTFNNTIDTHMVYSPHQYYLRYPNATIRLYANLIINNETDDINGSIDIRFGTGNLQSFINNTKVVNQIGFYMPNNLNLEYIRYGSDSGVYQNSSASCEYNPVIFGAWMINHSDTHYTLEIDSYSSGTFPDIPTFYRIMVEENGTMPIGFSNPSFLHGYLIHNSSDYDPPETNGSVVFPCNTASTAGGSGWWAINRDKSYTLNDDHDELPDYSLNGTDFNESSPDAGLDHSITIRVNLDLLTSGEDITNYQLFMWNCSNDELYDVSFDDRKTNYFCDNLLYGEKFTDTEYFIYNFTGDYNVLFEARRNDDFHTDAIKFNAVTEDNASIKDINLTLDYLEYNYSIGFISSTNHNDILSSVDYVFKDVEDDALYVSGISDGYVNFTYSKDRFNLFFSAIKPGYISISAGEEIHEIIPNILYNIILFPSNLSRVSVSGYVLADGVGVASTYANIVCGDKFIYNNDPDSIWQEESHYALTDDTGFFNFTNRIRQHSACILFVESGDKTSDDVYADVGLLSLSGQNITLSDKLYNDSITIRIQRRLSSEIIAYEGINNCDILIEGIDSAFEQRGRTDPNGFKSFRVPDDKVSYTLTANGDKSLKYMTQIITSDPDKHIQYITLFTDTERDDKVAVYYNCYARKNQTWEVSNLDGSLYDQGYTDNDGIFFVMEVPGETYKFPICDKGGVDESGGGSKTITIPIDEGETKKPPIPIDRSESKDMLDSLWSTITDASQFFEVMLILFIILMFVKLIMAFGGVFDR